MNVNDYRKMCQKNDSENYLFDKYVVRKLSIYFTIIFIKLRMKPNQATFFSLAASLTGCYFLMFNSPAAMFTAAAMIFTYYMLDHVDGELARYYIKQGTLKPSLQGQYYDVLIHKYSTNLMLFFIGISVYSLFGYKAAVMIGFAACIGMSGFPSLVAANVAAQKIARDKESVFQLPVMEVLYLLERKQEQLKKVKSPSKILKFKKIISELLFFPGCLISMMAVVLIDAIVPNFTILSVNMNLRFLYLIGVTPIYILNTFRQSLKWMNKLEKIN